jgi:hypothetical protein
VRNAARIYLNMRAMGVPVFKAAHDAWIAGWFGGGE